MLSVNYYGHLSLCLGDIQQCLVVEIKKGQLFLSADDSLPLLLCSYCMLMVVVKMLMKEQNGAGQKSSIKQTA